jgi:4-amino-4-deoxy-L-arabinose transferase-like glycosyltransferase
MGHGDRSRQLAARWLRLSAVPLLAFAVRVVWILLANVDPTHGFHFDMTWYHLMALRLASGAGLTRPDGVATAEWPPGYPSLVALTYLLSGASFFVQRLGTRLFGPRSGLVAALLLALCPGDVFFSPLLLSEIAFNSALLGTLALFALPPGPGPPGPRRAALLGVGLGLATLIRGSSLAFLPLPVGVWALRARSLRAIAKPAALAVLGLICVLAPWTLRNWLRLGHPVLVATSLGRTLAHAHSEVEVGEPSTRALRWRLDFRKQFEDLPQPEREVVTDRAFARASLDFALRNPGRELQLVPVRLATLYGHDHVGLEWGRVGLPGGGGPAPVVAGLPDAWLERTADGYFHLLLLLGLVGLPRAFTRQDRGALLVPLGILYFTLLHSVIFPGHPRYHFPVVPFLCLSAGALFALRRPAGATLP